MLLQKLLSFPDNAMDYGNTRRKLCEDRAHILAEAVYGSLDSGDSAVMLCATQGQVRREPSCVLLCMWHCTSRWIP